MELVTVETQEQSPAQRGRRRVRLLRQYRRADQNPRRGAHRAAHLQALLGRDQGDLVTFDHAASLARELHPAVLAVLADDAVHLDHVGQVDQVERAPADDCSAYHVPVEIEVALEQGAEPVGVPDRQLHNEIDVARHAWHRVVVGCERSGHHVRDPGGLEPSSDIVRTPVLRSRLAPSSTGPLEPQLAPHPAEVVGWPALQALAGRVTLHVLEECDDPWARRLAARGLTRGVAHGGRHPLLQPGPAAALVEGLDNLGGRWRYLLLGPHPPSWTAFERPLNAP